MGESDLRALLWLAQGQTLVEGEVTKGMKMIYLFAQQEANCRSKMK